MRKFLVAAMLLTTFVASAQTTKDPVIMRVNGQPVLRSEFEYSFNKNNADGVIDKKSIEEYVDLFVNYKLKVAAALDARLDTLSSFKKEFAQYRDQQIRPTLITDNDVEEEARKIYTTTQQRIDAGGGLRDLSHILIRLSQKATDAEETTAKQRIDSIYQAILNGADFAEMAKRFSADGTAAKGGELGKIQKGVTVKEFEDAAFALKKGEISKPVRTPFGYHIIRMNDQQMFFPYDSVRTDILKFIEQRGIREGIIDGKLNKMVEASEGKLTKEKIMDQRADSLCALDPEMDNLIREYHDGLLLYEISNQYVWDKAAKDEAGLEQFFKKNKKKYVWTEPRYKGMAYHVKDKGDVKAVRNCVKSLPFSQWAEALRTTFNNDSVIRIRVEKGIFKKGDNALIDREVFGRDTTVVETKGYPIDAVYGKILKKGPEEYGDVKGLVVADYQEFLEKQWVAELRQKYTVEVDKEVLKTVNHHE